MRKLKIKLSELLKERHMTQTQLAELSNMRPNAISNLARGYVDRLSIEHIEKICNSLQLESISDLIELENTNEIDEVPPTFNAKHTLSKVREI